MSSCPTCKQPIKTAVRRVCAKCHSPIALHDKYFFKTVEGNTFLEHRHCDNKESYLPRKASKR
jgi:hypothetical protein